MALVSFVKLARDKEFLTNTRRCVWPRVNKRRNQSTPSYVQHKLINDIRAVFMMLFLYNYDGALSFSLSREAGIAQAECQRHTQLSITRALTCC